jgi:hypothetical protein
MMMMMMMCRKRKCTFGVERNEEKGKCFFSSVFQEIQNGVKKWQKDVH